MKKRGAVKDAASKETTRALSRLANKYGVEPVAKATSNWVLLMLGVSLFLNRATVTMSAGKKKRRK